MIARTFSLVMICTLAAIGYSTDREAERPVKRAQLTKLIEQADKIVVFDGPRQDSKVLFSSNERKDIDEFEKAFTIEPLPPYQSIHCACIGTPAVRLYRGGTELVLITNHHGQLIRCSLWSSDVPVRDQDKWLKWFDARKISGPRKEVEENIASAKQHRIDEKRWFVAMPKSIQPLWPETLRQEFSPDLKPLRNALAKEFPDASKRILALLSWYGSGADPWSGYPYYEGTAEELLLDLPTSDILNAIQTSYLSEEQTEGAARLFGGWDFSKQRPNDLKMVPESLKKTLLEHSLQTTNKDKLSRAKDAFQSK